MGHAKPVSQTLDHYKLPRHHFLLIHQAVQHVSRLCPNKIQHFETSILDTLLERQQFKISDIYKPLNMHLSKPLLATSIASWNSDLNSPEAVSRIISGYNSTRSYVTNEFWREQQFKIMHRAYIPACRLLNNLTNTSAPCAAWRNLLYFIDFGSALISPPSGNG